jgi:hypothetical protein
LDGTTVGSGSEALFGVSSNDVPAQQLIVEVVPEPASVLFIGLGLLMLRRRR